MIRLYRNDCTEILQDILSNINGDYILVSDPPFNIGYHYAEYSDRMPEKEYWRMLIDIFWGGKMRDSPLSRADM